MSRRTPGRDPVLVKAAQLRAFTQAVVVPVPYPVPDRPHRDTAEPARGHPSAAVADSLAATSMGGADLPTRLADACSGVPQCELAAVEPANGGATSQVRLADRSAGERAVPGQALSVDELWAAYFGERSRALRDRLVVHYTPLVRAVAHRIAASLPPYVEHADLAQSGFFGLLDAVERFDPDRCPRFESYAAQRIRGAILDELRALDWVPRTIRGRVRELERAQERLEARLRRAASDRELAEELGLSLRDLRGLTRQVHLISVEALDEHGGGMSELLADDEALDPMAVVQARETLRQLVTAVAGLGERDQTVIRLYYVENRTLAEIGRLLGVTESRVCQLHSRLVGRLRGRLEELAAG